VLSCGLLVHVCMLVHACACIRIHDSLSKK